jgi:hypothetical protein
MRMAVFTLRRGIEGWDVVALATGPEAALSRPSAEELDDYLRLSKEEIVRLVLCLMIEEALQSEVAFFPGAVRVHAARHFGVGDGASADGVSPHRAKI